MKLFMNGLILLFLFLPLYAEGQKQLRITLQANESIPIWIDKGEGEGLGCEIIHAISQEMGISTKIEFLPLKRLIADTANNDLGNPLFYMNNQSFAAIIPIAVTYSALFSYLPHVKKCQMHPCGEKHIGVLKGTIANTRALESFGQFEESYSHESLFKKLQKGRIDLVLELNLVGRYTIRSLFPNEADNFDIRVISETASPIAIMIDNSTPDALKIGHRYQEGLHRIIQNGKYRGILQKYYGKKAIPSDWYVKLSNFESLYTLAPLRDGQ